MSDPIDRQAVIDTATEYENELREILGDENELVEVVKILKHRLIALPSAQAEKRTEERTETHACDCISRQGAIDALSILIPDKIFPDVESELKKLPPVQPEPCEDAVSRKAVANMLDNIEIPRNASWYLYYHQALDRLTKLPSVQPEPCEDAISRADAIRVANGYCHPANVAQELAKLPSVQPEPKWIPCSERLPEYNEAVLTWDGGAFCIEKRIPYIRDDDGEPIEGDWWVGDEYDDYESEYYPNLRDGAAIAWMPLPSAYQEEGENDEVD